MSKGLIGLGGLLCWMGSAAAQPVHDDGQRRAIRGCGVETACELDARHELLQFEQRAFPPSGAPWAEGAVGQPNPARELSPSEIPAWLRGIDMPDVPVRWTPRLVQYLEFYKNNPRGRNIMESWIRRQGRYRDLIEGELARAGLPRSLLYISMIESSYNPRELSYAGAQGLWQFMPAGGAIYGLQQDFWLDQRSDPVLATRAVVHYFADLYQRFGDWHLALAGFNAGYGAVLRSIAKYNTNDFWRLCQFENGMPWATTNYVPKFLAAAIVGENRRLFGFDGVRAEPRVAYDEVSVPAKTSLKVVAKAAGVDEESVADLNPHLIRRRTPPTGKTVVRIPTNTKTRFLAAFPATRRSQPKLATYRLRRGQRFEDVATIHGTTSWRLRRLNGARSELEMKPGTTILVPVVSAAQKRANAKSAKKSLYAASVPKGRDGDKLLVALPAPDASVRGKQRVFYRVVRGDTLYGIAKALKVPRKTLARWNGLNAEAHLHPRMVLQAFVDRRPKGVSLLDPNRISLVKTGSREHLDQAEARKGRKRVLYTARRTESYADIAKRYGLTARDLARINRKPHTTVLKKGETAIVYKTVDKTKRKKRR